MRFLREKVGLIAFLFLVASMALYGGSVQAYYGSGLYGGIGSIAGSGSALGSVYYSGMGGLYGGLGSMYGGLYGSSMYGGLMGGMYGGLMGGMYGSSMYGGLYGSSMYGGLMGGMYGSSMYGGLYGGLMGGMYGSSMYGGLMGGLYGSSMYGGLMGGMYGSSMYGGLMGGMYGSSLYGGLGRLGFGDGMEQMREAQVLLTSGISLTSFLLGTSSTSTTVSAPVVPALPNPTGTWNGTYLSYINLKGGIASFALTYNTLTYAITGTAGLYLNKLIPIPIPVSGLNSATGFTLTGTYFDILKLKLYYASYACTLITPSYMTGTYIIHDALYLETDTGSFNLSLVI